MKTLLQIAAFLSFGCCFAGGLTVLGIAVAHGYSDAAMIGALGLVLMGLAFFFGAVLLVAAERLGRKAEGK